MSGSARLHEVLVVGGGLAGPMAALRLSAAGRQVVLLEKERAAHHKVCGEFLSAEAVAYLRMAGVDPLGLGAAPIEALRVSAKQRVIETRLPFSAVSISRCVLDAALLERVEAAGCEVRRGITVQALAGEGACWAAQLQDGTMLRARNAFLATGKHDVRGWKRPPGRQNNLVGFKMHWRLRPEQTTALRGLMELYLCDSGYGGFALVERDIANLCFVIRRSGLRERSCWSAVLAGFCKANPLMAERLVGAKPLWERPLAVSSIPYGYLAKNESGVWRLGDQAAVIPSFTGDGMAIALHSGALAAETFLAGRKPSEYQEALRGQLAKSMSIATLLSRAMVSRMAGVVAPLLIPFLSQPIPWIARLTRIPSAATRTEFAPGARPF